jgi:hypothetical protein
MLYSQKAKQVSKNFHIDRNVHAYPKFYYACVKVPRLRYRNTHVEK